MSTELEISGVRRVYGDVQAVDDVSLTLRRGTITSLVGPSGCGKSTLLRLIAGLEKVDAGSIRSGGMVLSGPGVHAPPETRNIGFVFQDYALFPHLTVERNAAFGLDQASASERRNRAMRELERVRMADRAQSWPQSLSGGEQQRVALARALARDPSVVLLDEPFSGLDQRLKAEVRDATLEALRGSGAAVLVVTHDAEEALMMADVLALMERGRILQTGSPQDCYLRPASIAAARLLGEANLVPARVVGGVAVTAFGSIPAGGVADGAATVAARPEAVRLDPSGTSAEVLAARFGGARTELTLAAGGVCVHAHVWAAEAPTEGSSVAVSLDPRYCAVFA